MSCLSQVDSEALEHLDHAPPRGRAKNRSPRNCGLLPCPYCRRFQESPRRCLIDSGVIRRASKKINPGQTRAVRKENTPLISSESQSTLCPPPPSSAPAVPHPSVISVPKPWRVRSSPKRAQSWWASTIATPPTPAARAARALSTLGTMPPLMTPSATR